MWKQTNLGYLRVDLVGCRFRLLANGEPSLLDSVLDSTPLEKISANLSDFINFILYTDFPDFL